MSLETVPVDETVVGRTIGLYYFMPHTKLVLAGTQPREGTKTLRYKATDMWWPIEKAMGENGLDTSDAILVQSIREAALKRIGLKRYKEHLRMHAEEARKLNAGGLVVRDLVTSESLPDAEPRDFIDPEG